MIDKVCQLRYKQYLSTAVLQCSRPLKGLYMSTSASVMTAATPGAKKKFRLSPELRAQFEKMFPRGNSAGIAHEPWARLKSDDERRAFYFFLVVERMISHETLPGTFRDSIKRIDTTSQSHHMQFCDLMRRKRENAR